jgi:hypothetical protein
LRQTQQPQQTGHHPMKTVYIALSLTHVKTDAEKDTVRTFLKWFEKRFNVKILLWAFDVDKWTPKPVANIFEFDTERVLSADLAIFLYLTSDGSDGRGGELVTRVLARKPTLAFMKEGVKENRYVKDCLETIGVKPISFWEFEDIAPAVEDALSRIEVLQSASTR